MHNNAGQNTVARHNQKCRTEHRLITTSPLVQVVWNMIKAQLILLYEHQADDLQSIHQHMFLSSCL